MWGDRKSNGPEHENHDVGDRNVERLLAGAYDPEVPDPAFVEKATAAMHAAASEKRGQDSFSAETVGSCTPPWRKKSPDPFFRPRRSLLKRLAIWAVAASILIAFGAVLGVALFQAIRSDRPDHVAAWPIAQRTRQPDESAARPATSPPGDERAPALSGPFAGSRMIPRPRPEPSPAEQLAVGDSAETDSQRRRLELPDRSIVYLNANTSVTLVAPRQLKLDRGEIYVEAAPAYHPEEPGPIPEGDSPIFAARKSGQSPSRDEPDAKSPRAKDRQFYVVTPDREISALGTKFDVRLSDAGTGLVVAQGKVEVSGVEEPILAGQQLVPQPDQAGAAEVSPAPRVSHVVDWTRDLVAKAESRLVPASTYSGGALVVKDPHGQESKLSLRKYHVDVHVEDGFARTTIDQTFFNHRTERLEGTFHFPLPPDASLSRLAMYVGGKLMEGGMAERGHARQVFESIVRKMKDPALLEWVDGSTFKMRVFPLEGRQEKRIVISYTQRLPWLYDRTRYRFPGGHNMQRVGKWSCRIRIKGGAETRWTSNSHPFKALRDDGDLVLEASAERIKPDQDVLLTLHESDTAAEPQPRFCSAEHEGAKYLMLRWRPDLAAREGQERRDWVFLFESSADRDPLLARVQVDVIKTFLENANRDDTFSILTAGTRVHAMGDKPKRATPKNVRKAVEFLDETHLIGALDLDRALSAAKPLLESAENPYLVHVGSGLPVLGEREVDVLVKRIPEGARYVGVGVGKRWSRLLMKTAASRTGGYFTQINPDEEVSWRAFELFSTLNTSRLFNIHVVDNAERYTFLCHSDYLAEGEELCAIARIDEDDKLPKSVEVTGTLEGTPFSEKIPVRDVAASADYLPRTWAKLEIDRLVAEGAEKNRSEIVRLSKAMYVMSPFTSLLVLENDEMYEQYQVDRGRKDHWALYPCPEQIPVVHEPLPAPAVTQAPADADRDKPTAEKILGTVLLRIPSPSIRSAIWTITARDLYLTGWRGAARRAQLERDFDRLALARITTESWDLPLPALRWTNDPYGLGISVAPVPSGTGLISSHDSGALDELERLLRIYDLDAPPESAPVLEVYELTATDAEAIVSVLQTVLPDARLAVDPKTRRLIALGTADEHEAIRSILGVIDQADVSRQEETVQVIRLSGADPERVVQSLKTLIPDGRFSVDPQGRHLIALATPDEQQTVRATLDRLEAPAKEREVTDEDILTFTVPEKMASLVDEYNSLMGEQRFAEAEVVAKRAAELDPENRLGKQLVDVARLTRRHLTSSAIVPPSERGFWSQLDPVDQSAMSFDDRDSYVYGDARQWEALTDRRRSRLEALAAAKERGLINESLLLQHQKMEELMERINSLWGEGRYRLAEDMSAEEAEGRYLFYPPAPASTEYGRMIDPLSLHFARQKAIIDTLYGVERLHVPFPDEPPIIYPHAEIWQALTARRGAWYASIDLASRGPADERIVRALKSPTSLKVSELPLEDVVDSLEDRHAIEIRVDEKALEDVGIPIDTPITKDLEGISLRSALRLMLAELDLTYVIQDDVLTITSPEEAEMRLGGTRVYPVADLVVPIRPFGMWAGVGGMGGMGVGGMGGMGMGGVGGGMFGADGFGMPEPLRETRDVDHDRSVTVGLQTPGVFSADLDIPLRPPFDLPRLSSHHPGGVNAFFVDGSVSFISDSIDYLTYQRLMTPDGVEDGKGLEAKINARLKRTDGLQKLLEQHTDTITEIIESTSETGDVIQSQPARYRYSGVPPLIDGVVLEVRAKGSVEISLGSDDGLRKGHVLHVLRLGRGVSNYVGRVEVTEIEPDKAVCKVLPEFLRRPVHKGDSVTTGADLALYGPIRDRHRISHDLLSYAPGLNTMLADVRAVLETEIEPRPEPALGEVDNRARRLIQKARAAGWRTATWLDDDGEPVLSIDFDGTGRMAYGRTTGGGLNESVISNGTHLWHLYGELGLGARRELSRFHRAFLLRMIPWALPPVDDLARGADLRAVGKRTVAIVPRGAEDLKDKDGKPIHYVAVRLVFDTDDRLAERRLVQMPSGKLVVGQMLDPDGTVRWLDREGEVIVERKCRLEPCGAPDLEPNTERLVILPMPLRSREHLRRSLKAEGQIDYERVSEDAALAMIASQLGTRQATEVLARRFFAPGDRRLGLYVLWLAGGIEREPEEEPEAAEKAEGPDEEEAQATEAEEERFRFDPLGDHPDEPLAEYLAGYVESRQRDKRGEIGPIGGPSDGFVQQLAEFHDLWVRWASAGGLEDSPEVRKEQERLARRTIDFIRRSTSRARAWAMFTLLRDEVDAPVPETPAERDEDAASQQNTLADYKRELARMVAEVAASFEDVPGVSYPARNEHARLLALAGEHEQAQQLIADLYDDALELGVMLPIDRRFRETFFHGAEEPWRGFVGSLSAELMSRGARRAAIRLARSLHQMDDAALAEQVFSQAMPAVADRMLWATTLEAVEYLWHAGKHARADAVLDRLISRQPYADVPALWRLAAAIAEKRGMTARSLSRLERAMELEYDALPEMVELAPIRQRHGALLDRYQELAKATGTLGTEACEPLIAQVVRTADRWRSLDVDPAEACQRASRILADLGAADLAWDYLTTAVAGDPEKPIPWNDLAETFRQEGRYPLADRAYAWASAGDPANAVVLWNRAQALIESGRRDDAQPLLVKLAEGEWAAEQEWVKSRAKQFLGER